jgi:hypothetical protein
MSISTSEDLQVRKRDLSPLPSFRHQLPMSISTSEDLQVRKRDLSPLFLQASTPNVDFNF